MRFLYLIFLSLFIIFQASAQDQYATTQDGKRVILRSNGTWQYVNANSKTTSTTNSAKTLKSNTTANTSNVRTYIRGPRGGCYYINRNGGKTYVDRSLCN